MKNSRLQSIVLEHISNLITKAQDNMVKENASKDKGDIMVNNNPLCSAYFNLTDAKRWVDAYREEYQDWIGGK